MRWIVLVVSAVACVAAKSAEPADTRSQPPPLPPPPIEFFRQLLAMKPEEREKALALRVQEPRTREVVQVKVKQFEALPPDERENRLRTLELRWYLPPLMRTSPTNRVVQLQVIPPRDRKLVEARLKYWDELPADVKQDMLESELAIGLISRPENFVVPHRAPSTISAQQQEKIRKSMDYLNRLTPEKRRQVFQTFEKISELSQGERAKTLDNFSENDRKQMERTLRTFEKLTPLDRELCIAGFEKFSELSEQERGDFLRNAERWRALSEKDRAVWRTLVNRKAIPLPPMPPGLSGAVPPIKVQSPALATNSVR